MVRWIIAVLLIIIGAAIAADWNDRDTAMVEIVWRHDLGYIADTVQAVTWYAAHPGRWYVRTVDGEAWSDKQPRKLK